MYIGEVMFIGECGTQDYNLKYQKGQNQKPGRRKVLANHLVISTTYAAIGVKTKRTKTATKSPAFQGNKLQSHKYFGEWVKRININQKGTQKVNPRDNDNSGKKSTRARQMAQSCNTHRKMIYLIQEDNVWMK